MIWGCKVFLWSRYIEVICRLLIFVVGYNFLGIMIIFDVNFFCRDFLYWVMKEWFSLEFENLCYIRKYLMLNDGIFINK